MIGIVYNFKLDRNTGSWKRFPQSRGAKQATVAIKFPVRSNHFNCEMMRPSFQSRISLKFVKSTYQVYSLERLP